MKLSFGSDGLEVAADAVQVTKSDGSTTDQESVNQLLVAEITSMQQEMLELEARIGRVENIAGIVNWPLVGDDGKVYEQLDCHKLTVLASSASAINLPCTYSPLIMVNGRRIVVTRSAMEEELGYPTARYEEFEHEDKGKVSRLNVDYEFEVGDEILFVGDWVNFNADLAKVSIDRIGLNSATGKRNQVAMGWKAFANAVDCNIPAANLDISNLDDFEQMFYNSNFNGNINHWDVSNVTNMKYMFQSAGMYSQPMDTWDVSSVADVTGMFHLAAEFNQNISNWCLSNTGAGSPDDLGVAPKWQANFKPTPGACPIPPDHFYHIFSANREITWDRLPTNDLETDPFRRLELLSETVENGISLRNYRGIFNWNNDRKQSQMNNWPRIEQIGRNWDTNKTNQVQSGLYAFRNWRPSWQLPDQLEPGRALIENLDVSNLTEYQGFMEGCSWFEEIDLTHLDLSQCTSTREMFYGTTKMNPDMTGWDMRNVRDMSRMFYNAKACSGIGMEGWETDSLEDLSSFAYNADNFSGDMSHFKTSKVTDMSRCFFGVRKYLYDLHEWDVRKVVLFDFMFARMAEGCTSDLSGWAGGFHQPGVSLWGMFQYMVDAGAGGFPKGVDRWDVSDVTSLRSMFWESQWDVDVEYWDVRKCENFEQMFDSNALFAHDLSRWVPKAATNMNQMFDEATSFNSDLSGWCVPGIPTEPPKFADGTPQWTEPKPVWGTCPGGENLLP